MFKPTFLYIKQHVITGKLYFGKTTADILKYNGSGKRWVNHINYHGKEHIINLWYCLYTNEEDLKEQAISLSKIMGIVESKEFLNLQEENGLDGMPAGQRCESRKGFATYRDSNGNKEFLHKDDQKIKDLKLVGVLSGHHMSDESKEIMRRAKDDYRKITLHFMTFERTLYLTDPEFAILIDYGWTPYMQSERYELKKESAKQGAKKAMTGKNRFYHRDGTYYGMLEESDPLVIELDLVHIRSDKQKSQAAEQARLNHSNKEMQIRKGKTMSTLKWFHDPVTKENKRLMQCPVGWKDGRSESEESNKGRETWNDGIRNYMLKHGEDPAPTWIRGMAPRNIYKYQNN